MRPRTAFIARLPRVTRELEVVDRAVGGELTAGVGHARASRAHAGRVANVKPRGQQRRLSCDKSSFAASPESPG